MLQLFPQFLWLCLYLSHNLFFPTNCKLPLKTLSYSIASFCFQPGWWSGTRRETTGRFCVQVRSWDEFLYLQVYTWQIDLKGFWQVRSRVGYEASHVPKIIGSNDIVFFSRDNKSQWNNAFRLWGFQLKILFSAKILIKCQCKIKVFSDIQCLKKFTSSVSQQMIED